MPAAMLVLDASPLNHFARAGHLAALRKLTAEYECVTTRAVIGELTLGASRYPDIADALDQEWIRVVPCDELSELYLFAQYMNQLGNAERNAGEATVLAWAEAHGAAAYVDDQVACNLGRKRGVRVHRTLSLVVASLKRGLMTEDDAQEVVIRLADSDARFPSAARDDLLAWARAQHPPLI